MTAVIHLKAIWTLFFTIEPKAIFGEVGLMQPNLFSKIWLKLDDNCHV